MSHRLPDVDIDFADREQVLSALPAIAASMNEHGVVKKHNTGVYYTQIPVDPATNMSTLDYKIAEDRGYFKLDLLNVAVYQKVKDEAHLDKLIKQEPLWELLWKSKEFCEQVIHIGNYHDLIKKMKLYGFTEKSTNWIESYLLNRKQCVYIDGYISESLSLDTGVPQGSILGPLWYIIPTNDLLETIYDYKNPIDNQSVEENYEEKKLSFKIQCDTQGQICCFADDSTYSIGDKDQRKLSIKLKDAYNAMSNFMTNNKLKLNDDKTHFLVMKTDKII